MRIPRGASIRKTAQYKLYNCLAEKLEFFNSPDGVFMNTIRDGVSGGIIAYTVEFGRHSQRGKIYVYSGKRIVVTSEIPCFSGEFSDVDEAVKRINQYLNVG